MRSLDRPEDRIGRMVADRYRLERVIAKGGMGVVYAGKHTWTDRPVAVKLLLPDYAEDPGLLKRFFQEAKTAAGLRHPNVVDVLDMGEDDDGSAFLVLELLEGEPLSVRLERDGTLEAEAALRTLLPIMDALDAVHERGVIHRDLKPANVFLSRAYRGVVVPKLLDFGVAKLLEDGAVRTRTGSVLGTPGYMAPEQIQGASDITAAADVWGIGMVWFRTLAGKLPFTPDPNPTAILMQILSKDLPTLTSVQPTVPAPIARVVDGALRRAPEHRHPNMAAFLDGLIAGADAAGLSIADPRTSLPPGVI